MNRRSLFRALCAPMLLPLGLVAAKMLPAPTPAANAINSNLARTAVLSKYYSPEMIKIYRANTPTKFYQYKYLAENLNRVD